MYRVSMCSQNHESWRKAATPGTPLGQPMGVSAHSPISWRPSLQPLDRVEDPMPRLRAGPTVLGCPAHEEPVLCPALGRRDFLLEHSAIRLVVSMAYARVIRSLLGDSAMTRLSSRAQCHNCGSPAFAPVCGASSCLPFGPAIFASIIPPVSLRALPFRRRPCFHGWMAAALFGNK
jgi:hypothetical protein